MVGNTVLVTVWLSVGVLGVVVGLLWLRGVERSRRSTSEAAGAVVASCDERRRA